MPPAQLYDGWRHNNTINNVQNLPSEFSLVKNVGDLQLMSGNRITTRSKGTVRYCCHTRPNTEWSTAEVFVSGRKHCTAFQYIHTQQHVNEKLFNSAQLTKTLTE